MTPREQTEWRGTAAMSRGGMITLGVSLLVLLITTVPAFAAGAAFGWAMIGLFAVMLALIAAMLVFRVRIDADGLLVRSAVGWPRTRIAASDIAEAATVEVSPFAEFGGWGWRWGMDGRRGVVLRRGEAIAVTRTNGTVFVVTIDGAEDAAAVLAAHVSAVS